MKGLFESDHLIHPMSSSEEESSTSPNLDDIDVSGKFMWNKVTFSFLTDSLNTDIVRLNLSTNHIAPESAELLVSHIRSRGSKLRYLNIIKTRMSIKTANQIFSAIGESKILELYADDNFIPKECCQALADSLSKNPPLELLSINGCDVPAEGAVVLAQALKSNKHLKSLRMESNSIYDVGAKAIAEALPHSGIINLSLADNEIWNDGTTDILNAAKSSSKLNVLDMSYNILPLTKLTEVIIQKQDLTGLAISGCKVREVDLLDFLIAIPKSSLEQLLIDGFNFNVLPVSWPKVQDTIWNNHVYFEALVKVILNCDTLNDLRIGFLELDQINNIRHHLERTRPEKELYISMHDFGRTNNNWVATFPDFHLLAPINNFEWKTALTIHTSPLIGEFLQLSTFDEHSITSLTLADLDITDEIFVPMIDKILEINFVKIDLAGNTLSDISMEKLVELFQNSKIKELYLSDNKFTDTGLTILFKALVENPSKTPEILNVSFESSNHNELEEHEFASHLDSLFEQNCKLNELTITGPITAADSKSILTSNLSNNSHLQSLTLNSTFVEKYKSPDPEINQEIQSLFVKAVENLFHALRDKKSMCKLKTFVFPLLTEIYLYHDKILDKWSSIEAKLEQNKKAKGRRR